MEPYMNTKNSNVSSGELTWFAIYARKVSTSQPEIDADIERQIDECRQAAKVNGWTVAEDCIRIGICRNVQEFARGNPVGTFVEFARKRRPLQDRLHQCSSKKQMRGLISKYRFKYQ
jgi:DNA invertase Pin-like site-specific DNA recombinase